jgi:hypothetical protein
MEEGVGGVLVYGLLEGGDGLGELDVVEVVISR